METPPVSSRESRRRDDCGRHGFRCHARKKFHIHFEDRQGRWLIEFALQRSDEVETSGNTVIGRSFFAIEKAPGIITPCLPAFGIPKNIGCQE